MAKPFSHEDSGTAVGHAPMERGARLRGLIVVLRVFAAFALLTGGMDVLLGAQFLRSSGAALSPAAASDAILNSQIRFWGSIWGGFGAVLWWATRDLQARTGLLQILLATVFVAGVARLVSAFQFGAGSPALILFIAIELVGPVAAEAWRRRLFAHRPQHD